MKGALISLAEQVLKGGPNGLQANNKFRVMINELSNLNEALQALILSDTYLFVYSSNMIKLIQSGQFCIINETRSEQNIVNMTETPSPKSKTYGQILNAMTFHLLNKQRPHYISQSIIDLIGLCLKTLFEDNNNQSYLQSLISFLLPNYKLDDSYINASTQVMILPIEMRRDFDYANVKNYCTLLKIFISMFEYVTVQNGFKSYYQFRRSIYIFRNSYLGYFLQIGVEHLKALFSMQSNQTLRQVIELTLNLLEVVFMYPFTLSLHEFEIEDDINENITGVNSGGDIYLPSFFRHVICDEAFIGALVQYYHLLLNNSNTFEQCRKELNSLIKIFARSFCCSQYTYKSDDERSFARNLSQSIIEDICCYFKYTDSYYLNSILDIVHKHFTLYDNILTELRKIIVPKIIAFLKVVISFSEINIHDGKKNPFSRAFEIAVLISQYCKDHLLQSEYQAFKAQCQNLLEISFNRLAGDQANTIIRGYGLNQPSQIDNFTQLYQSIIPIFQWNHQRNLNLFQILDINTFRQGSKVMWLHLCSQLLPKTQADMHQTSIILKYYELASKGDSLAALRYIKTLSEEILEECVEGVSTTTLWRNIHDLSNATFEDFLKNIINICIRNFSSGNNEIIDYSLDFFKSIYTNLRKSDTKAFQAYYSIVQNLLSQIHTTIFTDIRFFSKRRIFFNVISVIWINTDTIQYIYQIHRIISANISSGTSNSFLQYLHDITGILQPLDKLQSFQIVTDLATKDLQILFQLHLKDQESINTYYNDPFFVKTLSKLVLAFITDINKKLYFEVHTDIPLKIHELFYPYVHVFIDSNREFPYQIASILEKMINLNPLAPLISFEAIVTKMKQQSVPNVEKLVRCYFENIQRVERIQWMYDLIEENIDYMVYWWEEAMFRGMRPQINLKVIAESRIWTTVRQKESLAKLIFQIGYYEPLYWNVGEYQSERQFVNHFSAAYS